MESIMNAAINPGGPSAVTRTKVKIQVSATPPKPGFDEVFVWLDDAVRGVYQIDNRLTPIDEALVLVGVERVVYDGEGDFRSPVTQTWATLKGNIISASDHFPQALGEVRLTKVWLKAVEEYAIKVAINGVEKGTTSAKLNYLSLRTILNALNFDVELVGVR